MALSHLSEKAAETCAAADWLARIRRPYLAGISGDDHLPATMIDDRSHPNRNASCTPPTLVLWAETSVRPVHLLMMRETVAGSIGTFMPFGCDFPNMGSSARSLATSTHASTANVPASDKNA